MAIEELLGQLTLEEKCSLLSGSAFWYTQAVERLGIRKLMLTDGPHGLRKQVAFRQPVFRRQQRWQLPGMKS